MVGDCVVEIGNVRNYRINWVADCSGFVSLLIFLSFRYRSC